MWLATPRLRIPVHGLRRKGRPADGDVLRADLAGRAVLHPLAARRDDRLARLHVNRLAARCDAEHSLKHDGVFVELGRLPRLDPASGAAHQGNAHRVRPGIDPANKLLDPLGLVARRLDNGGPENVNGHRAAPVTRRRWNITKTALSAFSDSLVLGRRSSATHCRRRTSDASASMTTRTIREPTGEFSLYSATARSAPAHAAPFALLYRCARNYHYAHTLRLFQES